ncbi:DUF6538 domain-containing protein [Rhizobium sp. PAMB 3174]
MTHDKERIHAGIARSTPSGAASAKPARRREHKSTRRKQASPGRYMVRSGSVYLFQIKVPKEIIADRPVIRISLGARQYRQARRLADLMAAEARLLFDKVRRKNMADNGKGGEAEAGDDTFCNESLTRSAAEMTGYLKAHLMIAEHEAPEPTAEERKKDPGDPRTGPSLARNGGAEKGAAIQRTDHVECRLS